MLMNTLIAPSHPSWQKIDDFLLKSNQIDIWAINLPKQDQSAHYEALHQQKKERHQILKLVLRYYLSDLPKDYEFDQNPKGKPFLRSHPLQFNMTHSQNYLYIALHTHHPIGIDIEVIKKRQIENFSRRFFGDSWFEHVLKPHSFEKQLFGFFQAWTQTEAWIKAHGETVFNFSEFKPSCFPESEVWQINPNWQMLSWMPQENLMGSVCFPTGVTTLRQKQLNLTQVDHYSEFLQKYEL